MKRLLALCVLFSTSLLHAETITSKIHSIEENLVKFENGRVAFLKNQTELPVGALVKAEVSERSDLTSFKVLSQYSEMDTASLFPEETTPPVFEPTIVASMEEANAIFNRSNPYFKRVSECTDRAHVWAHDEFKRSGIKSMKVFVFFTASYINSVRFKWWFHVAPMYKVNDNGTVKDMMMDYLFTDRPVTVKEWTDRFVYTKRDCKVTDKFSEYDVNPQTENCYLIYESMHYRLPLELAQREKGIFKTSTSEAELKQAFKLGFDK